MSISAQVVFYTTDGSGQGPSNDLVVVPATTLGQREFVVKNRGLQVVAVFVQRPNPQGGFFTDVFSTNSAYALAESGVGLSLLTHDSSAGGATRIKAFFDADDSSLPIREVDTKIKAVMMGQGATWDVLDDGQGSFYETKVTEATALVLGA